MRESLRETVNHALCIEMKLPNIEKNLDKTSITTAQDICMKNDEKSELAKIIYNGIVEYAVNEYELNYDDLEKEQAKVLARRIRYNSNATDFTKLKYGFYGEVLLDLILRCFLKTDVLLARGYLYSPIEKSEVKGVDAFHIMEWDDNVELWLGEAKFYVNYKKPVDDVLGKISYSLSDEYVHDNFLALIDWQDRFSHSNSRLSGILDRWEENPNINIASEIANENMVITYPIMIAYQPKNDGSYEEKVKECLEYIEKKIVNLPISITTSFQYKIFFIFLPVDDVRSVKECVYRWIDSKEPLI